MSQLEPITPEHPIHLCTTCRDLQGKPMKMRKLYVRNFESQHGRREKVFLHIGYWCQLCKRMVKLK